MASETWNISYVVPEAPRENILQNDACRWVLIANQQLQEFLLASVGIFMNF